MTEANTVTMRIYHPNASGYATATFAFVDGQLPLASDLETMITNRGWLLEQPGLNPGEDAEPILYVCRQNKEEEDGTITPKISFYSEVEHLAMRWLGDYLNNEKEVTDFEAATGLQVDKLPVWTDSIPPKRTDKKAQKFIIKLAKPIRVVRETYHTKDGDPRHKFVRFVDYIGNAPTTANKGSQVDEMLLNYTRHMYNHVNVQTASIERLYASGTLTSDMKPFTAACYVLMHRAHVDCMLDADGVKDALGSTLSDHLAEDGNSLVTAWNMIQVYHNSHNKTESA